MNSNKLPKAVYTINILRLLWGFSYYGVYALILSFFKRALLFSDTNSILIIGAYGALGPLLTTIGGLVSDRWLGARRSYFIGLFFFLTGYLMFGTASLILKNHFALANMLSIFAITIISVARGIGNSGDNVMITKSHVKANKLDNIDISYSYNYMSNNSGSTMAKITFGAFVASFGVTSGYTMSFFLAGTVVLLAIILMIVQRNTLKDGSSTPDLKPLPLKTALYLILSIITALILIYLAFNVEVYLINILVYSLFTLSLTYILYRAFKTKDKRIRNNLIITCMIAVQMAIFFIYYNQLFSSLILYPINIMQEFHIGSVVIGPESTLAFNSLWCIIGSICIIPVLKRVHRTGKDFHIGYKFALGMLLTSLSYLLFRFSAIYALSHGLEKISVLWFFTGHAFVALAEIFILNLGASKLSTLVPADMTAFVLGLKVMANSAGSVLAARIAKQIALNKNHKYASIEIFHIYLPFFTQLATMAFILSLCFVGTTFIMKRLEK